MSSTVFVLFLTLKTRVIREDMNNACCSGKILIILFTLNLDAVLNVCFASKTVSDITNYLGKHERSVKYEWKAVISWLFKDDIV